jgi:hypothetical protein
MWETQAMDRWIALGIFLLGAGVGAVTTVALYAGQIRHLRGLEAATLDHSQALSRDHSVTERQGDTSVERKSA